MRIPTRPRDYQGPLADSGAAFILRYTTAVSQAARRRVGVRSAAGPRRAYRTTVGVRYTTAVSQAARRRVGVRRAAGPRRAWLRCEP